MRNNIGSYLKCFQRNPTGDPSTRFGRAGYSARPSLIATHPAIVPAIFDQNDVKDCNYDNQSPPLDQVDVSDVQDGNDNDGM